MNIADIKLDITSFADDENDVIIDRDGNVLFTRLGEIQQFKLENTPNGLYVNYQGIKIPYKKYLAKEIAKLDVFANKLLEKKDYYPDIYIDADAQLITSYKRFEEKSLSILKKECDEPLFFGTKITFVTADAGHGKTVLLKQFQNEQAQRFIKGESDYLFWHIDLLGRDLVRLNEAIMYDLGLLRISGIYFSSILTLIRHNLIILGIDGFDELAAEIGGENALGSLSNLVVNMNGQGTLIAASRRTFFSTQDYIKRTKILQKKLTEDCEFDEIKIFNWKKPQNLEYLEYFFDKPERTYNRILARVNNDENHPVLSRPYLFTKIVNFLKEGDINLKDIISFKSDNFSSINKVIEAFVRREVNKWRYRDEETGRPYLSFDQHMELLAFIAQEMWENQTEIISVDNIQFILTILLEDWKIEDEIKSIRMVESHALLIPVPGKDNYRRFDHIEFKNFFIAKAMVSLFKRAVDDNSFIGLKKFLYTTQMPDSIANYFSYMLENEEEKRHAIDILMGLLKGEWKPTYLQPNIGTIIPFLLNNVYNKETIQIRNKLTFSSIVFENKTLNNIRFEGCDFINISFKNTVLKDISFNNSSFSEIRIYIDASNSFTNVKFEECNVNAVVLINKDGDSMPDYSPKNIINTLKGIGFLFEENITDEKIIKIKNPSFNKTIKRFLTKFNKSIYQYEKDIIDESYYPNHKLILEEVIPLLIKYKIIEEADTKKTRQAASKAWRLQRKELADVLRAEENKSHELFSFWEEVNSHE